MDEFKKHTTRSQFDDLMNRLCKGYLDRELNEKAKTMDEKLTVFDFHFLAMVTGTDFEQSKVASQLSLEERAEEVEIELFSAKLKDEVKVWLDYKRALAAWEASIRRKKKQDSHDQENLIRDKADSWCSIACRVSKVPEDGVIPSSLRAWPHGRKRSP